MPYAPLTSDGDLEGITLRTGLRALESLEALLLASGQQRARRNAWTAVLEDRRRARGRDEAERVLRAASAPRAGTPAT